MNTCLLKYQTSNLVPPPFAFAVECNFKKNNTLTFELCYLDRQDFTAEELEEEGFTDNDDLKLEVTLSDVWLDLLNKNIESSKHKTLSELNEEQSYLELNVNGETFYPAKINIWDSFIEELRQAVLEISNIEMPLKIEVYRKSDTETSNFIFEASFQHRSFTKNQNHDIGWLNLESFLKCFYTAELKYDLAKDKIPTSEGLFVNYGDGLWFELGKSLLIQPSKIIKWL